MLFSILTSLLALQSPAFAKPKSVVLRFDETGRLLNRLPTLTNKDKLFAQVEVSSPDELETRHFRLAYRCGPDDSPSKWISKFESLHPRKTQNYMPTLSIKLDKYCLQEGYRIEWELLGADAKRADEGDGEDDKV